MCRDTAILAQCPGKQNEFFVIDPETMLRRTNNMPRVLTEGIRYWLTPLKHALVNRLRQSNAIRKKAYERFDWTDLATLCCDTAEMARI